MWLEILAAALAALVTVFVAAIRARVVGCSRQVSRPYRRQNCGFYGEQIPSERAVHSMEHEAVWITPGLRRLRDLADSYVLVNPFANLPSPVVASAWGRQLRLDSVSDPPSRRLHPGIPPGTPNTRARHSMHRWGRIA